MGQTIQQRQTKVFESIDRVERKRHAEGHHAGAIHPACPVCGERYFAVKKNLETEIYAANESAFAVATVYDGGGRKFEATVNLFLAAPEMLEALEAFRAGFADGSIQFTRKRQSDSDPYHPANTLMCAALARAEGRNA